MKRAYKILVVTAIIYIMMLSGSCSIGFRRLKREQFEKLKETVTQLLGADYKVDKIRIINEDYSNEQKTEYTVDFTFDLNKPLLLFPAKGIPGKLIFTKDVNGEWICTFNSGNPGELFNLFQ